MLNIIKMELLRMFKSKSLYVVWGIMICLIILTTYMVKWDNDRVLEEITEDEVQAEEYDEDSGDFALFMPGVDTLPEQNVNLGMTVMLPNEPGEDITLFDMMFGNIQGKCMALFIVIFAVIYSTADISSGYIKNFGGQITRRSSLIIAKAVALFVYTAITMGIFALVQFVSNGIFLGYMKLGNPAEFGCYMAIQLLLHFAFAVICMMIAVLTRSNLISIIVSICLCMNVMTLLYNAVDRLLEKLHVKDFQMLEYTVTGQISMLPMQAGENEVARAMFVSVFFIAVSAALGCIIFEKRDIV